MFSQIKVWEVTCEKCGQIYESEDERNCFQTKKEAIEAIRTDKYNIVEDWCWHIKKGKIYCDDCSR